MYRTVKGLQSSIKRPKLRDQYFWKNFILISNSVNPNEAEMMSFSM